MNPQNNSNLAKGSLREKRLSENKVIHLDRHNSNDSSTPFSLSSNKDKDKDESLASLDLYSKDVFNRNKRIPTTNKGKIEVRCMVENGKKGEDKVEDKVEAMKNRSNIKETHKIKDIKTHKQSLSFTRHFSKRNVNEYKFHKNLTENGKHGENIEILVKTEKDSNDFIVKKSYTTTHANIFFNEVYWLLKLQGSGFLPKLIRVEVDSRTFWMTFCGSSMEPGPEFEQLKDKIAALEEVLKSKYGCYHNDIKPSNVCMKKDKIYLIDCGWMSTIQLDPGYTTGKYGKLHPNCFSEMKMKCIRALKSKKSIDINTNNQS